MKIVTINISDSCMRALQVLQDLGICLSRSEAIRAAIRDFLQRELGFARRIDDVNARDKIVLVSAVLANKKKEIARLIRKLRDETPDLSSVS